MGSGKLIKQAVLKHGKENFTKEFLEYAFSQKELFDLEIAAIQKEKELHLGQYNLFIGAIGGDTFSKLNENQLADIRKKISFGLQSSTKVQQNCQRRKENNLKKKIELDLTLGDQICSEYLKLNSVKKVAELLSIPKNHIAFVVKRRGIALNILNVPKDQRKFDYGTKTGPIKGKNIRVNTRVCLHCEEVTTSSRSKLCENHKNYRYSSKRPTFEEIHFHYMEEDLSIEELMSLWGFSARAVYNFIEKYELPTPRQKNTRQ